MLATPKTPKPPLNQREEYHFIPQSPVLLVLLPSVMLLGSYLATPGQVTTEEHKCPVTILYKGLTEGCTMNIMGCNRTRVVYVMLNRYQHHKKQHWQHIIESVVNGKGVKM
jgi:hypothetical protein